MLSAVLPGDDIWVVSLEEALKENNEVATVEANANVVQVGGWVRVRVCAYDICGVASYVFYLRVHLCDMTCVYVYVAWLMHMYGVTAAQIPCVA